MALAVSCNGMRLVPASLDAPEGLEAFMVEFAEGERGVGGSNDYRPAEDTMADVVAYSRLGHALNDALLHHGGNVGYYVKRSERRKGYGRLVLALTLAEGRKRGLQRFLLTVDSDNPGSIRVIEANGGVLEDERVDPKGCKFRRYWIG